ncbi:hypothetical protein BDW59DRAFT_157659 [Aspergillus cavernicola]|uniref:DUF6594 domain-containing protein n=1 Tax=Aspergillus cavernicola TaxID=176166 RepID=A0ABR4IVB2_9EURO
MEGYDKIAALMTGDKGLAIFRSFKKLNAKNLLYLQAEITIKEKELNDIMQEDRDSQDFDREKFSASVWFLKGVAEPSEQWKKWVELRELLEKYNTACAQHAQLLRYKPPHKRDLKIFREWVTYNTEFWTTEECGQWFGADEHAKDLITLFGRYENVDPLTKWVYRVYIPFWHQHVSRYYHRLTGSTKSVAADIEAGAVYYSDEKIVRATRITSTIVSSVIPASSMIALYFVNDMITRLVIIVIYNVAFSVMISLMAKARRVEVFAASIAFAAVQVSFINFPRD